MAPVALLLLTSLLLVAILGVKLLKAGLTRFCCDLGFRSCSSSAPPDWLELPNDLLVYVFNIVNREVSEDNSLAGFALGRLVCKTWRQTITDELRASLKSFHGGGGGTNLSFLRLYALFPNLRSLSVYLYTTRDHYAIFYFRKLERIVLLGPYVQLFVETTANMMQVFFANDSILCPKCLPEELSVWYDNYRAGNAQRNRRKLALVRSKVDFRLKGAGARSKYDVPIVHQIFGVTHKPVDWDIIEYLQLLDHPCVVGERIPFITECTRVAVQYQPRTVIDYYIEPMHAIRNMIRTTILPGARVWVCGRYRDIPEDVEETYEGRTLIKANLPYGFWERGDPWPFALE